MPAARRLVAALVGAAVATGLFLVAGPAPAASATQRVTAASSTSSNGAGHSAVPAAQAKVVAVAQDHAHLDVPGVLPGLLVAPVVLLLALATTRTPRLVPATRTRPVGRGPPRA